jgi:hypothetical protein
MAPGWALASRRILRRLSSEDKLASFGARKARMKRRLLVAAAICLASCISAQPSYTTFVAPFAASVPSPPTHVTADRTFPQRSCPKRLLPLTPDAVSKAAAAALRAVPRLYAPIDTRGAIVTKASRASYDTDRGRTPKIQCGDRVWHRTVVVYLFFPRAERIPSASLSQGVVFVGRGRRGAWRVWEKIH